MTLSSASAKEGEASPAVPSDNTDGSMSIKPSNAHESSNPPITRNDDDSSEATSGSTPKQHNLLVRAGNNIREKGVEATAKGAKAGAKLGTRLAKSFEKLAVKKSPKQLDDGGKGAGIANPMKSMQGIVRAISKKSDEGEADNHGSKSNGGGDGTNRSKMMHIRDGATTDGGSSKNHDDSVAFSYETFVEVLPPAEGSISASTDNLILWVVAFSIAANATYDHWEQIVKDNSFPLTAVLAWMFLAFAVGVEIDAVAFFDEIKNNVLGLRVENKEATNILDPLSVGFSITDHDPSARKHPKKKNFFHRLFKKNAAMSSLVKLPGIKEVTALKRQHSRTNQIRKENKALDNTDFLRRLERFGHHVEHTFNLVKRHEKGEDGSTSQKNLEAVDTDLVTTKAEGLRLQTSSDSVKPDISMGKTCNHDSNASTLLEKVVQPLCELRGLDLFRTDNAESDMLTHPFLIKNGLREFPTFMINILTVYGNIIVYFKLPDWVQDWNDSLVETDDDPMDVKALKRFLSGNDDYRKHCFKIMPELVVGPSAVKMLAPRNREFCLELPPFMLTDYKQEAPTGTTCPTMSLTLDLVTNSTMRGLVGIFKRNMSYMTVDFACIIDGKEEDGATCVFGLWRMDHLVVEQYPVLPDRFATSGVSNETLDSIRGSLLVQRWNEAVVSARQVEDPSVVSEADED